MDITRKILNALTNLSMGKDSNIGYEEIIEMIDYDNFDASVKNMHGENSLHLAVEIGNYQLVEKILYISNRRELEDENFYNAVVVGRDYPHTPLSIAINEEDIDTFKLLLKEPKIDVNFAEQDGSGRGDYPLFIIDSSDFYDEILKRADLDINIVSMDVDEADICFAAFLIKYDMIVTLRKVLKMKGLNVKAVDWSKNTLLHYAASETNNDDFLKLILELKDIDINAQNDDGDTAFMTCLISSDNIYIVDFFKNDKLDLYIKNDRGVGAIDLIVESMLDNYGFMETLYQFEGFDVNKGHFLDLLLNKYPSDDILDASKYCLDNGYKINYNDLYYGRTEFARAVERPMPREIVQRIISLPSFSFEKEVEVVGGIKSLKLKRMISLIQDIKEDSSFWNMIMNGLLGLKIRSR